MLENADKQSCGEGADGSDVDYLLRAKDACAQGDAVLGMHLYLTAFEKAAGTAGDPSPEAIDALKKAWDLACDLKERSLAEYIFGKLDPFLSAGESSECSERLQQLALDKLEEFGLSRGDLQDVTEAISRDFLGIDAKLYFFGDDGEKVSQFVPNAVTMSAETMRGDKRIRQAAQLLKTLHGSGVDTGVPFEVFDMAAGYEKIIEENSVPMFGDYAQVKAAVMAVKAQVDSVCDIQNVPCHNDPLCENWVVSADDDRLYLIDWEYAGMNDGIWDLADVSIEGVFTPENDELLLTEYLGSKPDQNEYKHFLANKIYVDYLWTLWAKTRVPYDGQPMEDWAVERYARLKDNLRLFAEA